MTVSTQISSSPPTAAPPVPAKTFSSASTQESLAALQGSELLANGCVNLIALDAIRARAGELWPRKRELVWEFTEKHLRDRLAPHDLMFRVDDTTYLVAIVADYATAAQAVCMRVLEEVLLHFIGHLDRSHISIRRVDTISEAEIGASAVDISRIPRLEDAAPVTPAGVHPSPQREREKNPTLFTALSGRELRIDFAPRPVCSLKHGVLTALHLFQTVTDVETGEVLNAAGRDALTDGDLLRIDAATLDYASLFTTGAQDAGYVALIIPVSYRTLLNRRGRAALVECGAGQPALKTGGLFEIVDMSEGTPLSRIAEAVAVARAMVRGVMARMPEGAGSLAPFIGIGLGGMTVPLSRHTSPGVAGFRTALSKAEQVKRAFKALIALEPPAGSSDRLLVLGYTHASMASEGQAGVKAGTS